eukprot:364462-Chlamydomonas_euryale.AAC.11
MRHEQMHTQACVVHAYWALDLLTSAQPRLSKVAVHLADKWEHPFRCCTLGVARRRVVPCLNRPSARQDIALIHLAQSLAVV